MQLGTNNGGGMMDRLKNDRDRFVAFAFASADILMELDEKGKIIFADGATKTLLDFYPNEIINQNILSVIHEDDVDLGEYLLSNESKNRIDNVAIRFKTRMGSNYPFIMSGYKVCEMQGHYYITLSSYRQDINLADIARRDLKTGLLRKSEFSLAVNKLIMLSKFSEQVPQMTILVLDGLKEIEDEASIKIMREISDLVRMSSINSDSAGLIKDDVICFVHHTNVNPDEIKLRAEEIAKLTSHNGIYLRVSSVTINLDTVQDVTEEDTIQSIVYTLNKFTDMKGENMNYLSLVDCYEEMVGETVCRLSEFKRTVQNELFDLAYQPIVEVKTGKVTHFEVLTRLRESKAFANPFQFIEFGENVGLISEFDMKMVMKSMKAIREMNEKGLSPILSVNLSGFSLSSKVFMDTLEEILQQNLDICPQLIFEITESAKIANKKVTNEYFKKIRGMGVMCCIDDFGTGEATFEYLRNLDVDIVKIDGSYISDEAIRSANGKALLRALGRLCQDLGVKVVGEKVEHLEAVNMLAECGIQYGQGYFYAKPSIDMEILKLTEIESKKATVTNINDWR